MRILRKQRHLFADKPLGYAEGLLLIIMIVVIIIIITVLTEFWWCAKCFAYITLFNIHRGLQGYAKLGGQAHFSRPHMEAQVVKDLKLGEIFQTRCWWPLLHVPSCSIYPFLSKSFLLGFIVWLVWWALGIQRKMSQSWSQAWRRPHPVRARLSLPLLAGMYTPLAVLAVNWLEASPAPVNYP